MKKKMLNVFTDIFDNEFRSIILYEHITLLRSLQFHCGLDMTFFLTLLQEYTVPVYSNRQGNRVG